MSNVPEKHNPTSVFTVPGSADGGPDSVGVGMVWTVLVVAVAAILGIFMAGIQYLLPYIFGPYATAFGDAGPLGVTRGVPFVLFIVLPIFFLLNFLRPTLRRIIVSQVVTVIAWVVICLLHGYYLNNIVHRQGMDRSLARLSAEIGLKSADELPDHLKRAFQLSFDLSDMDNEPWFPRQWTSVAWPEIVQQKVPAPR